jgi:hypothetical protein
VCQYWNSQGLGRPSGLVSILKQSGLGKTIWTGVNTETVRAWENHLDWIYNYPLLLCNKCLSPLKLWVRIQLRRGVLDATLCDKVCQLLATGRWFSPDTLVFSTNKTDSHDITELMLKMALNTAWPIVKVLFWLVQLFLIHMCITIVLFFSIVCYIIIESIHVSVSTIVRHIIW